MPKLCLQIFPLCLVATGASVKCWVSYAALPGVHAIHTARHEVMLKMKALLFHHFQHLSFFQLPLS